jgi:multidrug transporter EmrE-like cation transporter
MIEIIKIFSLLLIYFFLSLYGLYHIKEKSFLTLGFAIGFCSYLAGFFIWLWILKTTPISIAFPLAAGGLTIGSVLVGFFFLGENVNFTGVFGVIFIVIGMVLISIMSRAVVSS